MSILALPKIHSGLLKLLFLALPLSIALGELSVFLLYITTALLLAQGKLKFRPHLFFLCLVFFLGSVLLSSLLSGEVAASLAYSKKLWRVGLPLLICMSFFETKAEPTLDFALYASLAIGIYALFQPWSGIDLLRSAELQARYLPHNGVWHAVGAFSHHLSYGGVTLLLFSLYLPLALVKEQPRRSRLLYGLVTLVNLAASFATMGRSIWLGVLAALLVVVLFHLPKRWSLVFVLVLALGFGGLWKLTHDPTKAAWFKSSGLGMRIYQGFNAQANQDRILMWEAALKVISTRPLFGQGAYQDQALQKEYDLLSQATGHEFYHPAATGVHNIYLQTWVDFGLLGLLAYLGLYASLLVPGAWALLRVNPKHNSEMALLLGCLAGLVGLMVEGIFENNFRDGEVQIALFCVMGLGLAKLERRRAGLIAKG